jgi:predicted TIM-barrel fold metal-dependent hydrolase
MENIYRITDCNCFFGRNSMSPGLSISEENIIGYHEDLGTVSNNSTIILTNMLSVFYDPVEGDNRTAELIGRHSFTKGCLVFPNSFIGNEQDFEKYLAGRFKEGFRILRLYPRSHKYIIEPWAFKMVFKILEKFAFPVLISLDELDITGNKAVDWDIIYRIAGKYPRIPFILDGGNSKELMFTGYFYQLLDAAENVFLESHNLLGFNQVEDITNKLNPSRIVFGSNYPVYPELLAAKRLMFSRLNEEDRKNILSGNIDRIISNISLNPRE